MPTQKTALLSHTHDIITKFSCRKIKPGLPAFLAPGEGRGKKDGASFGAWLLSLALFFFFINSDLTSFLFTIRDTEGRLLMENRETFCMGAHWLGALQAVSERSRVVFSHRGHMWRTWQNLPCSEPQELSLSRIALHGALPPFFLPPAQGPLKNILRVPRLPMGG